MRISNRKIELKSRLTLPLLLLGVSIASVFLSCNSTDTLYSKFYDIGESGWRKEELLDFDISQIDSLVLAKDADSPCAILLTLRHTDIYPYRDLWLMLETVSDNSQINVDTLRCVLVDKVGVKTGRGNRGLYEWEDTLAILPKFPSDYKISVGELMRDSVLNGIMNVGVSIIRL